MSTVSPFSATQIGLNPMTGNGPIIRKHFKEESYGLISHLSGNILKIIFLFILFK